MKITNIGAEPRRRLSLVFTRKAKPAALAQASASPIPQDELQRLVAAMID